MGLGLGPELITVEIAWVDGVAQFAMAENKNDK